ncbi:MAG: SDR family oxidoreductase [Chitinophagaceae bacterium]|jgi:L-fucose dehydrogenase
MDLAIKDKVILVTGGAKGIGEGITRLLAKEGAFPVVIGRNEKDNQSLIDEIGTGYQITAELSKPEDCKNAVEKIIQQFNRIDGVINNAGINDGVSLEKGSYEGFIQSLHNNVVHYYLIVQAALPALIQSKGSIVNISSKVAETGQGGTSGYAAANGARNALTREWAVELLKYGIRVNAVIVAECYTPLYDKWIKTLEHPEETLKKITARIPLEKRMTTAEEIANTAVFLLSEKSSHTTGQLIHVDGGYVHLDRAALA